MSETWTAATPETGHVSEDFPYTSPVRFHASIDKMIELLGPANSEDDPSKTSHAWDVTNGTGYVHCYDYKAYSDDTTTDRSWSVRGDVEGLAESFAAWVEA